MCHPSRDIRKLARSVGAAGGFVAKPNHLKVQMQVRGCYKYLGSLSFIRSSWEVAVALGVSD